MNSIRALTPFERGQAAYAEALSHVDYPAGSDQLLQWASGLCSAALLVEQPDPRADHGLHDAATATASSGVLQ